MDRRVYCLTTRCAAALAATGTRAADPFPNKPVRIIVP